ncbi:MAG: hypothetical protein ABIJ97_09815 [Bacteroidota bacterium]
MIKFVKYILYVLMFCVVILSCKKQFDDPKWDVDVLAPLLKTTVTIDQIVEDSIMQINQNQLVSLIYQNQIYSFKLDSLFNIPDTSIEYTAKLSSLDLGTIEVSTRKSLGDIAMYDFELYGPTGDLYQTIMTGHNTGNPTVIDAVDQQVYNDLVIDATQYFQTAIIQNGFIDIEFINGMPIDFTNIIMEIKNESNGSVVVQDTFPVVHANGSEFHTKPLTGITVEGYMLGSIMFESPGSVGNVTIDTSMAIVANITVRDLSIESATAIFPTQNIVDQGDVTSFSLNDIQLSEVIVHTGSVNVKVYNTIEEPIHYEFEIPNAKHDGIPLEITGTVPASNGSPGQTNINKNLSGYQIDLKGIGPIEQIYGDLNNNGFVDQDTVNSIYYKVIGRIDSSGNLISLSLDDSIYVKLEFSNIVPEYARGYLGQQEVAVSGSEELDIFSDILSGSMDLSDVNISISVSNQIGAEGGIYINNLTSKNIPKNLQSQLIIPSQYIPFQISKPNDPYTFSIPVIPTLNVMNLNTTNSNPDELVEIMPDQMNYNLNFKINPFNPPPIPGNGTDFIYLNSEIIVNLDVEMPLSLIADNITLIDTSDFKMSSKDIENINYGKLILYADNQFPFEAIVQLYMLDEANNVVDSLLPCYTTLKAGNYNYSTGLVDSKKRTKIEIPFSNSRLNSLLNTKRIKILTRFTSNPYNTHVKIYSFYSVDFILVGDFSYQVN